MSSVLESEAYIDACTNVLLAKMATFARTKRAIDLGEWIQWYTFDIIGELFYGRQFGIMRDEHDFGNYIGTLDTMLSAITLISVLPTSLRIFQPVLGFLAPRMRRALRGYDGIRDAAKYWVQHRLQEMQNKTAHRVDLLDMFRVRGRRTDFDVPEIQVESLGAIFAGSDTTAITIRAILYYLMKTPSAAYNKLMTELDTADRNGQLNQPHIQYSQAIKLPYLTACYKEVIPDLLRAFRPELSHPEKEWTSRNFWFNKQTEIQVYVTARALPERHM
ncbi:cytochrome P450 [Aspergillus crustosus]